MPNVVYHSVWNISPTISVGNGQLYQSSFVEHLGSGGSGYEINKNVKKMIRTLNTDVVSDVSEQINDAIRSQSILLYSTPKIRTDYGNICREHK